MVFWPLAHNATNHAKPLKKIHLETIEETLALQEEDDLVDNGAHGLLLAVDGKVGLGGNLIGVVNTGEVLDLASAGLGVDAALVRLLAVLERGGDVHEVEVAVLLDQLAGALAGLLEGGNGSGDNGGTGPGQLGGNEGNASNVLVAVLAVVAKLGRELVADVLAEEQGDGTATLLVKRHLQSTGDLVLAGVRVAGEENGKALLGAGRVRLAQHLDDLGVREPLRNLTAAAEAGAELGSGDVEGADTLGDLVNRGVLVAVGKVGHHLERNDLDAELVAVLLNGVLGIVGAVEVDALAVLAGTGVVTADDEVGRTVVLADDGVPNGLAGTAHAHGKGEETEDGHAVGVSGKESLVDTDTGEVVNVTGLGQAYDGVDEDVGMMRTGSADGQLSVGAVHGVTGLEGDDSGPAELVEVGADLRGRVCYLTSRQYIATYGEKGEEEGKEGALLLTSEIDEVVVLELVNSLKLAAHVELLGGLVEELDSRVLLVSSKDLLSLKSPGLSQISALLFSSVTLPPAPVPSITDWPFAKQ